MPTKTYIVVKALSEEHSSFNLLINKNHPVGSVITGNLRSNGSLVCSSCVGVCVWIPEEVNECLKELT